MGWAAHEGIRRWERSRTTPLPRLPSRALRGPTTLEQHALPAAIITCFATLGLIQVILTW